MKKRRRKQLTNKKKRFIVLNVFLVLFLFIGIGYSSLSTNLNIFGDVNVKKYVEPKLYNVLEENAQSSYYAKEYEGDSVDTINEAAATEPIFYWQASPSGNTAAEAIKEKWNVIFAGFCWQMYRTTSTGATKMIYNGVANNGQCTNTGADQAIGSSPFNSSSSSNSPANFSYMYNTKYITSGRFLYNNTTQYVFGNSFVYSGGTYTLTDTMAITGTWSNDYNTLDNHHYTCFTTSNSCTELYYVYYTSRSTDPYGQYNAHYITLTNGKSANDALNEMLYGNNVNMTSSTVKEMIDGWYANNLAPYTSKIEDVVYCNDRSATNAATNGWNPNGGSTNTHISFKHYSDTINEGENFDCSAETDRFSVANNKAKLTYPIGLPTAGEMNLLGNDILRKIGGHYWLLSPYGVGYHTHSNAIEFRLHHVDTNGNISYYEAGLNLYVRPVIALPKSTEYILGDGSTTNPYVVDMS